MEDGFRGTIETNPEIRKIWMELGTGKKTSIDYLLPLSNSDQGKPFHIQLVEHLLKVNQSRPADI